MARGARARSRRGCCTRFWRTCRAPSDPALLVGLDTADDAAVYRVADDLAIVTTADFFTPIVDDPYDFGRIAATNALSDVYAMGGRPVTALNLVAYSIEALGTGPLREILRGGGDVCAAAGRGRGGRALDRRPRAEVRPGGHGAGGPGAARAQLHRARGRCAVS